VRRGSRIIGALAALSGAAVLVFGSAATVSAGANKRAPKIVYAEFSQNPDDQAEYRFRVGAQRAKSVVVQLKKSPEEGVTTGRREVIPLDKSSGGSSPPVWIGFTSKTRSDPCYRAAYVARNGHGRDSIAHRLCIFGHEGETTVRVTPW
jgi:hypothetical protein